MMMRKRIVQVYQYELKEYAHYEVLQHCTLLYNYLTITGNLFIGQLVLLEGLECV